MFQWVIDLIWEFLSTLGGWLLDILMWLLEWVYEIVNAFLEYITGLVAGILDLIITEIAALLPDGWVSTITAAYSNIEYIDSWIPVSYGLKLFVAYYGIKAAMIPIKWLLKAIPGIWG